MNIFQIFSGILFYSVLFPNFRAFQNLRAAGICHHLHASTLDLCFSERRHCVLCPAKTPKSKLRGPCEWHRKACKEALRMLLAFVPGPLRVGLGCLGCKLSPLDFSSERRLASTRSLSFGTNSSFTSSSFG